MFIDEATIRVQGGRGGDGVISFISNRHSRQGGPDGGNGGSGGSVVMRALSGLSTLYAFRNEPKFRAGDGKNGGKNTRRGARGADKLILVPVGTLVRDVTSGETLVDLSSPGDEVILVHGGEGGRGNRSFTTSVRQAPRICERGLKGEEKTLRLELKLIADVGIIGYPNVGKSSLISCISAKRAKVADYPFTTLVPNLGVVDVDGKYQFVAVDIPGLIEGAHAGRGLGDRFLRHVERTRVLVHMIDLAMLEGRDALEDYHHINAELAAFSEALMKRPQVIVGNKVDLLGSEEIEKSRKRFAANGVEILPISVANRRGIRELIMKVYRSLQAATVKEEGSAPLRRVYRYHGEEGFRVDRDGDVFIVEGEAVERLVKKLNLDSHDAWEYLSERLRKMGVLRELNRRGFASGDLLRIGDVELELKN